MNFRVVFKLIGRILLLLAGSMVLPLVVALLYQESPFPFLSSILLLGLIGGNMVREALGPEEEVETACAADFVRGDRAGLDRMILQGGKNLSGGQRQRLTIARALVRRPKILILDDSASALDYATDAKLRSALRNLEGGATTFIVSQRASSIRHADKIIVLDDGEMAGIGTHDELLENCEVYKEIYYSQYPEERLKAAKASGADRAAGTEKKGGVSNGGR